MQKEVKKPKSMNFGRKLRKKKIAKILRISISSIIILSLGISFTIGTRRSYFSINRNYAQWIKTKGQKYLYIEADNEYELGKLEGKYLSAKITNMKRIIQLFGIMNYKQGFSYSNLKKIAWLYEPFIPAKYKEEMSGMDHSITGVTYTDILIQNCFLDILYGKYFPEIGESASQTGLQMGCSVVAYKNNHSLFVGQNFDFNNIFKHTLAFVYHSVKGEHAQFCLKVGGILSIPCGTNSANVSVYVNVVNTHVQGSYLTPISFRCRKAFDTADDPEQFLDILKSEPSTASLNYLIANNSDMISVNCIPGNYSISRPDFCVNTNTYMDDYWQQYLQDTEYSKSRQYTAENLLLNFTVDNNLSQMEFMTIMSNPLIGRSESGMMGISTLAFITTSFYGSDIPSIPTNYPSNPLFS
jgi:predicted choloylglycine hydrolase